MTSRAMINSKEKDVREIFQVFLKKVNELKERQLIKDSFITSFITYEPNKKGKITQLTFNHPDHELLRSLCIDVRYFLLKNETGYIFRIYNLCQQYLKNEEHKKYLILSRKMLESSMNSSVALGSFKINGKKCSPKFAFDTFINSTFHHDPICVEFLEGLDEINKIPFLLILDSFIIEFVRHLLSLGNIIENVLKKNEIKNSSD